MIVELSTGEKFDPAAAWQELLADGPTATKDTVAIDIPPAKIDVRVASSEATDFILRELDFVLG